ncbi:hypothetical protein LTS18_007417 [Coniosporium uncinatum]|uniref:Uncharacterized protein n=1 Tax=Coniosporium uncinatum TaxID=93489 RepID=A0ACC3D2W9_9PEZI|nr:hypothetical protein LTS18_007417 [Coniosporium uncinatum]
MEYPLSKLGRMSLELDQNEADGYRQRWIQAAPSRLLPRTYCKPLAPKKNWKPHDFARLERLLQEIYAAFPESAETLRTGSDDCPFPFDGDVPGDWSWWSCWVLFGERLWRTWKWCNGRWVLFDNIQTLFLECLWQHLQGLRSMFNLPVVLWIRHPLRFVIGHAVHGSGMRTAWTTTDPTSVADRDQSLLNVRVETAFENYAAWNFPASTYDQFREELQQVSLPEEMWYPISDFKASDETQLEEPSDAYEPGDEELEVLKQEAMEMATKLEVEEQEEEDFGENPLGMGVAQMGM